MICSTQITEQWMIIPRDICSENSDFPWEFCGCFWTYSPEVNVHRCLWPVYWKGNEYAIFECSFAQTNDVKYLWKAQKNTTNGIDNFIWIRDKSKKLRLFVYLKIVSVVLKESININTLTSLHLFVAVFHFLLSDNTMTFLTWLLHWQNAQNDLWPLFRYNKGINWHLILK